MTERATARRRKGIDAWRTRKTTNKRLISQARRSMRKSRFRWYVMGCISAAVMCTVFATFQGCSQDDGTATAPSGSGSQEQLGITNPELPGFFANVTKESGIDFVFRNGE